MTSTTLNKTKDKTLFDRKKIDIENREDFEYLHRLRQRGFARGCELRRRDEKNFEEQKSYPNKFVGVRSTAYEESHWYNTKGGIFVDAGSGMSADAEVALREGFKTAYNADLFPWTSISSRKAGVIEMKADIAEKIPLPKDSVDMIICQAVLPLMCEKDRISFYKEAYRILKKNKVMSVYFCELNRQHPWNITQERLNATKVGFSLQRSFSNCFILAK